MGTAERWPGKRSTHSVHPHRRGDGFQIIQHLKIVAGSPPQAWGRPPRQRRAPFASRFTPTGVGTAELPAQSGLLVAVHPHRRGDGKIASEKPASNSGSPPQAWGRRHRQRLLRGDAGSPPQAWGRRRRLFHEYERGRFTPHRRGDGRPITAICAVRLGSPPQAWGRPCLLRPGGPYPRFTPTGVGTAVATPYCTLNISVHPHRRGDGIRDALPAHRAIGSPPQAWGRLRALDELEARGRFTPTGVGTAYDRLASTHGLLVHPHRRGDGHRTRA